MPTCKYCGAAIEFRYLDGRCVPIHPDGGWQCGSWSRTTSPGSPYHSTSSTREWREREFTHPTHCPECGADVYFIRHNGGSVWVDELGWPWPKHACFDTANHATRSFSTWSAKSSGLTNPKLGIILRIRTNLRHAEPYLEIRLTDSSHVSLVLRWTPPDSSILGALVIISQEDSVLLHPDHAEIPFHSFTVLQPKRSAKQPEGMVYCFRCCTLHDKGAFCDFPPKTRPPRVPNKQHEAIPKHHAPAKLRPDHRDLELQIQTGISSVAKQAWVSVAESLPTGKRLKQAKQVALLLIRALPPAIKGHVEHRFISSKWAPLIAAGPRQSRPEA